MIAAWTTAQQSEAQTHTTSPARKSIYWKPELVTAPLQNLPSAGLRTKQAAEAASSSHRQKADSVKEKRITTQFEGQVGLALIHGRAGPKRNMFLGDNINAPTYAGLTLEGPLGTHYRIAGSAAFRPGFNPSDRISLKDKEFSFRPYMPRLETGIFRKRHGALWLGYGEMASHGVTAQDLSGTAIASNAALDQIGGAFIYDESVSGNRGYTGKEVNLDETYDSYNGLGRHARARVDLAPLWGITLSSSVSWTFDVDLAARWRGQVLGMETLAAIGFAHGVKTSRYRERNQWGLSFSTRYPAWGTSLTFAHGAPNLFYFKGSLFGSGASREFFYYAKLAQDFNLFAAGKSSISLDYGFTQWYRYRNEDVEKYGLAFAQRFDSLSFDWYISLHTSDLDEAGPSEVDETQTFMTGIRFSL